MVTLSVSLYINSNFFISFKDDPYTEVASLYSQMRKSELTLFHNERAPGNSSGNMVGASPSPQLQHDACDIYDVESQQIKTTNEGAKKPAIWKQVSVKHRQRFERLLEVLESTPDLIENIGGNRVCFKDEFAIGSGSYGTKVYICLGSDGVERAVKCLSKNQVKYCPEHEQNILLSKNVLKSPRIVQYCFFDKESDSYFDYLILNLFERNLEEYVKDKKNRHNRSSSSKNDTSDV